MNTVRWMFFVVMGHMVIGHASSNQSGSSAMKLSSSAFKHGASVPRDYTCDGDDFSPPLTWEGVPTGAKSLALICDDPDAPIEQPWVHWVVYNIPPTTTSFDANVAIGSIAGATTGMTNFGRTIYNGPCPPKGHGVHRYFFKLYALDVMLKLSGGATKDELLVAMKGHVLAQAELMGTFKRD